MKRMKWILLMGISLFLFSSLQVNAQKVKLESGDFALLKGQKALNVECVYDNLKVGKKSEDEYIKTKVAEYNKDEAGKGDRWLTNWKNDRQNRYQPKFENLMNEYLSEKGIKVGTDKNAKYTVIVKTTMIEPGFNVGVWREDANINVEILFVETANKTNVLAKVTMEKVPGRTYGGYDFDMGQRIEEAYAKCGKELAKLMLKKGLK
jgi:hypothetical protein